MALDKVRVPDCAGLNVLLQPHHACGHHHGGCTEEVEPGLVRNLNEFLRLTECGCDRLLRVHAVTSLERLCRDITMQRCGCQVEHQVHTLRIVRKKLVVIGITLCGRVKLLCGIDAT